MALVKYNNNSISAVTSAASIPSGALTHIKTLTASSSSTLSFVHGSNGVVLDSTYPIYVFKFINIHTSHNESFFEMNMSVDGGSNYNVAKTTTYFKATHAENDNGGSVGYDTAQDLAQGTGWKRLFGELGGENDESSSGEMTLFNPSSTTFVKHFMCNANVAQSDSDSFNCITAGYANTTSAVNAVIFQIGYGGNIQSGKIKLYGIKDS